MIRPQLVEITISDIGKMFWLLAKHKSDTPNSSCCAHKGKHKGTHKTNIACMICTPVASTVASGSCPPACVWATTECSLRAERGRLFICTSESSSFGKSTKIEEEFPEHWNRSPVKLLLQEASKCEMQTYTIKCNHILEKEIPAHLLISKE